MTPARRRFGWLAALSLLLQGWLPVVLEASLVAAHRGDPHAHHMQMPPPAIAAAAAAAQSGQGPACPVTHDPICLCAIFVASLTPGTGPAPGPLPALTGRRRRLPTRRPDRSPPVAPFEARAPPTSG